LKEEPVYILSSTHVNTTSGFKSSVTWHSVAGYVVSINHEN